MPDRLAPKASPLPAPLRGADAGTFAHYSVASRLPEIARRVLAENQLNQEARARIGILISEIPAGAIRPLRDNAPDSDSWQKYIEQYLESTWLDVPWFFAETYFYRRILEAIGYFESGPGAGLDPYAHQKMAGLETSVPLARVLSADLADWISQGWNLPGFAALFSSALWANQVDLSLWPVGDRRRPSHAGSTQRREHLLVDDSQAVFDLLSRARRPVSLAFLIDNAGFELICDLILADYLLTCGATGSVRFLLKTHPTFVSDATPQDVAQTVAFLAGTGDGSVTALASRLETHIGTGQLLLRQHPYWTSPLEGWRMPEYVFQELSDATLVVCKGDANYRRLLGDRQWEFTSPFADIVSYFPAPIVALRTLKSEVAAGLAPGRIEVLQRESPDWMTNGRFGVIQYASGGREAEASN